MNHIKNIIFDLGGVIINLDPARTRNAFTQLGFRNFDALYSFAQQSGTFDLFDKGLMSNTEFRSEMRKYISTEVTDVEIDAAWNAMLLDVPAEKIELLQHLKSRYRTFLLSNTNRIHVECFSAELERVHGSKDFSPWMERCYYSCDIGMRKPDEEIFRFVLQENNLVAEETLFIDDSIQHISGANRCGLETLHFIPGESLQARLENIGVSWI
jgi:putative hydrolase of the HAD superfamily